MSFLWYLLAALAEIAGCFAFWAWLRLHRSPLWTIPGIVSLIVSAALLTRVDAAAAGRVYAAYGGIYILSFCRLFSGCGVSKGCDRIVGMFSELRSA